MTNRLTHRRGPETAQLFCVRRMSSYKPTGTVGYRRTERRRGSLSEHLKGCF